MLILPLLVEGADVELIGLEPLPLRMPLPAELLGFELPFNCLEVQVRVEPLELLPA